MNYNLLISYITFLLLFLFIHIPFISAISDYNEHKIEAYTTIEGLSNNQILKIEQDSYGFMWLATIEGLNKFDGENFTVFSTGDSNISLAHNNVQDLFLDKKGNLWIATSGGLHIYDYVADSIEVVKKTNLTGSISSNDIMCFAPAKDGGIWIGTYDNGVDYYDCEKKTFSNIDFPAVKNGKKPVHVTYIYEDNEDNIWIGTQLEGLFKYNKTKGLASHHPSLEVSCIYQDSNHNIWIASSFLGMYNEDKDIVEEIEFDNKSFVKRVTSVQEDKEGNIWVGTDQFLATFELQENNINTKNIKFNFIYQQGENWGFHFRSVESIKIDKDNNIWIGTRGAGLFMIHAEKIKFKHLSYNRWDPHSLTNNKIETVCYDYQGNLYFGIDGYGIDKFNRELKKVTNYRYVHGKTDGLSNDIIISSLLDSKGNLWFGTFSSGVNKMNLKKDGFVNYTADSNDENRLVNNDVRSLFESADGIIWMGTSTGLSSFYNNKFDNSFNEKAGVYYDIRAIGQSSDSVIWLGTYGEGLISYDYKKNVIKQYFNYEEPTANYIFDIKITGDSLWLATQGAGVKIRSIQEEKEIGTFDNKQGLINNYIQSIVFDKDGNAWLGTNKGISCIAKSGLVINLNSTDGFPESQILEGITIKDKEGIENIVFVGFNGVSIFNPNELQRYKLKDDVLFTSFKIFNQSIRPGTKVKYGNPLNENIISTKEIVLHPHQSFFSIGFTTLDYGGKGKINYSYTLSPLDKDWNEIGHQSEITLRNLPAGKYKLKVKADGNENIQNKYSEISIVVKPVFWKTPIAYVIYLIVLGIIGYIVWYILTIKVKALNKIKLERTKRFKDEELHQAKLQFFTNISHELRTPLTLIIGPVKQLIEQYENKEIVEPLNIVLKNANRLLTLVNQLLDFRKAERGERKLRVNNGEIVQYIRQIINSFDSIRKNKEIQISITTSPLLINGWYDSNFLGIILNNLLSNAYKNTPINGQIRIEVVHIKKEDKDCIEIKVIDNGRGIPKDEIGLIFNRFYQTTSSEEEQHNTGTGIGLHLVSNLVKLHHGTIQVESKEREGSTFTVELPICKSAYTEKEIVEDKNFESEEDKVQEEIVDADTRMGLPCILVVEDDEEIRKYIKRILFMKYRILEAGNGMEALCILQKEDCDIIISDIMMPEMDGIALCKAIKGNIATSHIPVILLTAKSSIDDRIEGLEVGADSYIPKPFHARHLLIRVEKLIESRQIFKERFSKTLAFQPTPIEGSNMDEILLQKIVNYISQNLSNSELNGEDIGKEVNMSRMSVHRKLKSLTGNSTSEFIRLIRLKQAAYLIENTQKNITEVCYETGFNYLSYFTTCFTNHYKITPTAYMKEKRRVFK